MPVPHGRLMIYFAPGLEKKSQAQNDFVAHAALNQGTWEWLMQNHDSTEHLEEYLDRDDEIAADNLVKQWGYPVPAYRKHNGRKRHPKTAT